MSANPELRRNLWLEATPVRLVLVPAILAGILYLASASDAEGKLHTTSWVALVCVAALTWVWGAHLASEAVLAEQRGRTWDWQRMSGVAPWTLAWGKLAGSTALTWYGGALCLAVYAVAGADAGTPKAWVAALFVLGGVLAQAASLFAALQVVGRGHATSRATSSTYLVFGALVLYPVVAGALSSRELRWYGRELDSLRLVVWSVAAFAAFAMVGVWVRVRRELRVPTLPLAWPAFVAFAMAWAGGFAPEGDPPRRGPWLLVAFGVAVLLTWASALVDRKDPVALRRLAAALRAGDARRVADGLPPWLVALPLVLAPLAVLVAAPGLVAGSRQAELRWALVAIVLFLLRDLALLVHLNLGARPKRADLFAVVLFLVGYVLVPLTLTVAGWKPLAALFYPDPDRAAWSAAGAFLGAAVVSGLLARRWRERERAIAVPGDG